ncbi:hypothetical protein JXI42_02905 [bacterium]|nr:hypothetical protein [bacterium]
MKGKMRICRVYYLLLPVFVFTVLFVNFNFANAEVPGTISYQGCFQDASGEPLTGVHTITYNLYTEPAGGTAIWTESHDVELDSSGLYSVMLGSINPFESAGVDFSQPYYLGLSVDGSAEIGRHQISTSPYAFHAIYADSVTILGVVKTINEVEPDSSGNIELVEGAYIHITEVADSNKIRISGERTSYAPNPLILRDSLPGLLIVGQPGGGNIVEITAETGASQGIRVVNSENADAIVATASGTGRATGVTGITTAGGDSSAGVYGLANSPNLVYGVKGVVNSDTPNSAGVYGENTSFCGAFPIGVMGMASGGTISGAIGVYGVTQNGFSGVKGYNPTSSDICFGVWGEADHGTGVYGNTYSSSSLTGGVFGRADSGLAYGVLGVTGSSQDSATAVVGQANNTEGMTRGVAGYTLSNSSGAIGVYGENKSTTAFEPIGIMGVVHSGVIDLISKGGKAVYGEARAGQSIGVMGKAFTDDPLSFGVYGEAENSIGVCGVTFSDSEDASGVRGEVGSGLGSAVYGLNYSTSDGAKAIFGHACGSGGHKTIGVRGLSTGSEGIGVIGEGFYGIVGVSEIGMGSAAVFAEGDIVVGERDPYTSFFVLSPENATFTVYDASGSSPITTFGGTTQRVAIQKINSAATPTIPDNNFTVSAEAPLVVTTGTHSLNISCPECCTEPCGGGGCVCEGSMVVGTPTSPGELSVYNNAGSFGVVLFNTEEQSGINAGGFGTNGVVSLKDDAGDPYTFLSQDFNSFAKDVFAEDNLYVTNNFTVGGTKSFVVPHPEQPGMNIKFYCAESPEVIIEYCNSMELEDGYGKIELPHEFVLMSEQGTYRVMATPQSDEDPGRISAKVTKDNIVEIRSFDGPERLKVAFVVYATRLGYKEQANVVPALTSRMRDYIKNN